MPARPSNVETDPSCMTPSPEREHSAAETLILKRLPEHTRLRDRQAVVAEADCALVRELGHLGQLAPALVLGGSSEKADRDARLEAGPLVERSQDRRAVDDRAGVRHRQYAAETPCRGR